MQVLEYPFDGDYILKKRKSIKRELLASIEEMEAQGKKVLKKKIAILGGSTTHDVMEMMELFLLNQGIVPSFYESEYGQYWEDVMFENAELNEFAPDIIYVHTSVRNIRSFPQMSESKEEVDNLFADAYKHFEEFWKKIAVKYGCPIIQNNFELPYYRLLGNKDFADAHGRINFVNRLNSAFAEYAQKTENFYIADINYMSSCYGLDKWADPFWWHMYKYACAVPAIPSLAFNVSNIIKSVYGKNKKALVLDLDNTLWGGIVGDDGPEGIEIGQETSMGQLYSEFQTYLKEQRGLGTLLNVDSKNDEENALAGLNRPDGVLKPDDFQVIKANWDPKDKNLVDIAGELNIGIDSLVFVDDNPAERHIVRSQVGEAAVPEIGEPTDYIRVLDRSGFFEITGFSEDDIKRNDMYKANALRQRQQASFEDYSEYLRSLEMRAEIADFSPMYMSRIAQLTNKSNQFNLTTKRCTQSEIEGYAENPDYITLYGKLEDKFGDNGVVTVVFGNEEDKVFHIDLWLMSCRVLKRDMEYAMMDELVRRCMERGLTLIRGYYYPTAKNKMVKDFYGLQGFSKISEDEAGNTVWEYALPKSIEEYEVKNKVIAVN